MKPSEEDILIFVKNNNMDAFQDVFHITIWKFRLLLKHKKTQKKQQLLLSLTWRN